MTMTADDVLKELEEKEFCGFSTTVFHQFSHSTKQSICFPRCWSPKMEMKTRREKISRSPFVARQTSIDPAKPSSFSWVIAVVEHRKGVCFSPTDFHFLKDIFVCLTCIAPPLCSSSTPYTTIPLPLHLACTLPSCHRRTVSKRYAAKVDEGGMHL